MDTTDLNELNYKLDTVIDYLKNNKGHEYKLYNYCCPDADEPDSDIVEYAEDVKHIINTEFSKKEFNKEDWEALPLPF